MLDNLPFQDLPTLEIEHDFVYISVYQDKSLMLFEWKCQISFLERKKGSLMALDLINQYQIRNWISSDQHLFFISAEEKNWLLTEWIDMVSQSPLLKLVVVVPDDYNYVIDNYNFTAEGQKQYQAKSQVQLRTYKNFSDAFAWILSYQDNETR